MDEAIDKAKARVKALCEEIGLDERDVSVRVRELENAVDNALSIYVGVVLQEIDEMRDHCTRLYEEIKTMQTQLSDVDFDAHLSEIKAPYLPVARELEATKTKLLGWHTQRSKRSVAASKRIVELESALEEEKTKLPTDLSQNSICGMEARVADLIRMRDSRVALMDKVASEVEDLWSDLGIRGQGELAEFVATYQTNPDPWLGKSGVDHLQTQVQSLRDELEARKQQTNRLVKELQFLYEMLEIPPTDQSSALTQTVFSEERLAGLSDELQRLQEAKVAHMSKFIEKAKARLRELWEKMYFSEEETKQFAPYHSSECSEEILKACQDEIARIEALVRDPERLHLFAMVHRLKTLQAREIELERIEKDPSRFNKRGKERLEEQRMRSSVAKKPEVVRELKVSLEKWHENHEPFLIYGKPIIDEVLEEESKLLYRRPRHSRDSKPAAPPVRAAAPRVQAGRVEKRPLRKPVVAPAAALRRPSAAVQRARQLESRRPLGHTQFNRSPPTKETRRSAFIADSSFDDPQMEVWRQKRMLSRQIGSNK
ncbi:Anaphase spindle elongation protein 1 [Wickerhamiella sorbophila]|uniref:Anaphase spindle elongation protein 1 n=1 Tax=Wickerhamiella sorbophila TaxID=45607 RepID=A0A2T0FLJ7_9ASCO|nr:Anaphase spindle elongation protein 1 [Wickerhamiella sorbophila]PRT55859.1 Anaphase spindle elongation protein 1 [Wickerhamiella sorbophila]